MKTMNERLTQSVEILRKIKNFGINTEFESIKQIRKELNEFVKSGNNFNKKFYIEEYQFYIYLILTNKKNKDCSARISIN